jgi:uncharacterized integral membrane protein (TIGR00698 family)
MTAALAPDVEALDTEAPDTETIDYPGLDEARTTGWRGSAAVRLRHLMPGLAMAAAVAGAGTVLGRKVPVIGAPVFAIIIGILVSAVRSPSAVLRPGLEFTAKRVLQGSIVVLGLGLSFRQVVSTGKDSLPVLVGTLVVALAVAWLAGRAFHLRRDLNTLIGVGTAICGASAIAATDAVISADEADVSYAIATIFTFNVAAVLAFPSLGHLFGLSQHAFGLWAGTAINDTSSVVAASTIYGHAASSYAVVVKLTRTLAIVPICLGLAAWRNRRSTASPEGAASLRPTSGFETLRRVFPLFILGFLAAVAFNTFGLIPPAAHHYLSDVATWMITAALAAIGLSTRLGHVRRAGPRPILLGAVLWATVGVTSLALQAATGTI